MTEEIGNRIFSLKSGCSIGCGIGPKVSANLGFGVGIGPKPKQWFRSYTNKLYMDKFFCVPKMKILVLKRFPRMKFGNLELTRTQIIGKWTSNQISTIYFQKSWLTTQVWRKSSIYILHIFSLDKIVK